MRTFLTFQNRRDDVLELKGCHYKDSLGKKCANTGIAFKNIENLIIDRINLYKKQILSVTHDEVLNNDTITQELISEKELMLSKLKKALERLNDAYEMGDYSRDEWIERKKKREFEIHQLNKRIYELKKQEQAKQNMTNNERLKNLELFYNSLRTSMNGTEQNTLYRTIIESIMYLRDGDNIELQINFL